MFIIKVFVIV